MEIAAISSSKLEKILNSLSVDKKIVNDTLNEFNNANILKDLNLFDSHYKRMQYLKIEFNFVTASEIFLGQNNIKQNCYMQYVPIIDTIKTLLTDENIIKHINEYGERSMKEGTLCDVMDGAAYRKNDIFKNPNSLSIILFQDAFEVVNPLGSARKKHKIIGVYFTLANLHPSYRSNVDNIQLVLLCWETNLKSFGHDKIFGPLRDDLKLLESEGITVNSTNYKGTIISIVGDNLGSHMIGGFLESFNSEYFCRYCETTQTEFKRVPYAVGKIRDPASYNATTESIRNDDVSSPHQGIKFESIFNQLNFFHVCNPGLPPCLGHDLFEGVVAYDLALFIKYFVEEKSWFTYEYLNSEISIFKYNGTDGRINLIILLKKVSYLAMLLKIGV